MNNHKISESYGQEEQKTKSIHKDIGSGNSSNTNKELLSDMYSNPSFIFFDNKSGIVSIGVNSFWKDYYLSCTIHFKCISNSSTGWKSDKSFQVSTTNNTNNTWSWIRGMEIDAKAGENYQLVSHMKLNNWATASHVVLEGFNETSNDWDQIVQCPSGLSGPMEWREFKCTITIPERTTKIRPVLNAGWSSQPNKEATTWFDAFYVLKYGPSNVDKSEVEGSSKLDVQQMISKINSDSSPRLYLFDNRSQVISIGLDSFSHDEFDLCRTGFKCISNSSTGWKSDKSFQVSTTNNTNNTWSSIHGQEIDVKSNERYKLITHMKLNKWATQSHVALEGYNETSGKWYQIEQCPSGVKSPLEWQEFSCLIRIPENTTEIREVLNAGWSSDANEAATTWFDSIFIIKEYPFVTDPNLKVEALYQGLEYPATMAFLGPDDILVLENKNGTVQRIVNGVKSSKPILDLAVRENDGLLGIAVAKNMTTSQKGTVQSTYLFLYFTAAEKGDVAQANDAPGRNRLYRYELVNNNLVYPKLLLDLPGGFMHIGGKVVIGPDKYIYLVVGELSNKDDPDVRNIALNSQGNGTNEPDGRGGILRIDQNGQPIGTHGILGDKEPLKKYYAYGIRNSFGMDFDPITGKLWDTENGPARGDEINLAEPGFNSGWSKVQGIWDANASEGEVKVDIAQESPDNLVDFNGRGKYSFPELTWNYAVGPTDLKFLSTDKLGKKYENDMLVADGNNGRIYHFKLNQNRTALSLQGPLIDKVADTDKELDSAIFAEGFGLITDLEIGPDGYLYFASWDEGKIYRIVPGDQKEEILPFLEDVSNNGFVID
jgi:glucose/arabinose dehydrogenase